MESLSGQWLYLVLVASRLQLRKLLWVSKFLWCPLGWLLVILGLLAPWVCFWGELETVPFVSMQKASISYGFILTYLIFLFCFVFIEAVFCSCIAQASPELRILLPQAPQYWGMHPLPVSGYPLLPFTKCKFPPCNPELNYIQGSKLAFSELPTPTHCYQVSYDFQSLSVNFV